MDEAIMKTVRRSDQPAITLEGACWLVWPTEPLSEVRAAMSSAQFVHFNAPVVAVQRNDQMEYFDENQQRRWSSNLAWPRANLEMARLFGRAAVLLEDTQRQSASASASEG